MNIAIFQPRASYFTGGGEVIPVQQALYLAARGHQVTFITTRAPFIKESELFAKLKHQQNLTIEYLDVPKRLASLYAQPAGVDWRRWDLESLHIGLLARDHLVGRKFDITAVHNVFDAIAVPPGAHLVTHLHGYPPEFQYHQQLIVTLPQYFIAVSKHIMQRWQTIIPASQPQGMVVENGIDLARFTPTDVPAAYDVLYIGRLIPVKGIDTLLHAAAAMPVPPKIAIAGIGPYQQELQALATSLGLSSRVDFLGYVSDKAMNDLYNSAKVIALPSKDREGILTTLLEAASCARPIVTTTAGSMKEFITHEQDGLLVSPENPAELAQALQRLLADEVLRRRLGIAAQQKVTTSWGWDRQIQRLEAAYQQILTRYERGQ